VLSLVNGLSAMRIHTSIELLHLGLQPLLKVGLTLPVLLQFQPYKCNQVAPFGRWTQLTLCPCCRRMGLRPIQVFNITGAIGSLVQFVIMNPIIIGEG